MMERTTNASRFAQTELDILSQANPESDLLLVKDQILDLCEAFGNSGQSGFSAPFVASAVLNEVRRILSNEAIVEVSKDADSVHYQMTKEINNLCDGMRSAGVVEVESFLVELRKLLVFEPIMEITGVDSEWVEVAEKDGKPMFQNRRCSAIFKDGKDGKAYYIDAVVKRDQRGVCWTGYCWLSREDYLSGDRDRMIGSRGYLKSFPFTPKTFYIDVEDVEIARDDWESFVKDPRQLDEVWQCYDRS